MSEQSRGGRPAGSRNIRPSAAKIVEYRRQLQAAADAGNLMAAAMLVALHERCLMQTEGDQA
nr:hypothetical protein [uncultured Halomonas sp.]